MLSRTIRSARFSTSVMRASPPAVIPPVRRVGALRGGFTGFLVGVTLTGAGAYYYLFDEYEAAQRAILADVIGLRQSLQELQATIDELKTSTQEPSKSEN